MQMELPLISSLDSLSDNILLMSIEKLHLKIKSIRVMKLPSLEMFGKNDPYVSLTFGDSSSSNVRVVSGAEAAEDGGGAWRADTSVQDGAGASASWAYGDDEAAMQLLVSGAEASRLRLGVKVLEYNKIAAHGFLGSTEMSIVTVLSVSPKHTLTLALNDKKGAPNGGSIEIVFDVFV